MRSGTPGFCGARLTQAREAWGLSAVTLAEWVGVSSQSISNYEKGGNSPSPDVMDTLASKLNLPRAFFLRPPRPEDGAPIFWRSKSAALKVARRRASVRLSWLKEIVIYLEQFFNFPKVAIPDCGVTDFRRLDGEDIDSFAHSCRKEWGLGIGPLANLCSIFEGKGILISRMRMDAEGLNAFCQWPTLGNPFICLGSDKYNVPRSRFDAAHELAHLVLHRGIDEKRINTPGDLKLIEAQAYRFASSFLMPSESFAQEIWSPTLDSMLNLKERWGCSIGAMIKACEYSELVNEEQAKRLWINYNRRGWRNGEPLDDRIPAESPVLLRKSFDMLVRDGGQPKAQILLQLRLNPNLVEELAALPNGYFHDAMDIEMATPRMKSQEEIQNSASNVIAFASARGR